MSNIKIYNKIDVLLDDQKYPIIIGKSVINSIVSLIEDKTKCKKIMIISDFFFKDKIGKNIESLFLNKGYEVHSFYMDAGKVNKNINQIVKIYRLLEENYFPRDATIFAIGGGVIGDLVGFVASTWLRGMNLVHIPTTLMAMLDSSVGGKVAINFRQTINAIGNYYHPVLNIIDLDFVNSLSDRDFKSGLAEVIKCAIIHDKSFYHFLEKNYKKILSKDPDSVIYLITKSIEIKLEHVKCDVREGGKRLLLNFGHTLGHAIEISTEKNHVEFYRHGEGVSIGIVAAAYIAEQHLGLSNSIIKSFEHLFNLYDLPIRVNLNKLREEHEKLLTKCILNVNKDKKRKNNALRLVLVQEIGQAEIYSDVPIEIIEDAFAYILN